MSKPTQIWGDLAALPENRRGALTDAQRKQIRKISIFDPWLRIVFGAFFLVFGLTQRPSSWQFWVPVSIALVVLATALNGLLARRRLRNAKVEILEGAIEEVKIQRANGVAATLHRAGLYMFLLEDKENSTLPEPATAYRFFVVFGVLRPGIVVAMERLPATGSPSVTSAAPQTKG